jgi:hypothetical protein
MLGPTAPAPKPSLQQLPVEVPSTKDRSPAAWLHGHGYRVAGRGVCWLTFASIFLAFSTISAIYHLGHSQKR